MASSARTILTPNSLSNHAYKGFLLARTVVALMPLKTWLGNQISSRMVGCSSNDNKRWIRITEAALLSCKYCAISVLARTRVQSIIRSEEHTSELQSRGHLVCRLLLEKKNNKKTDETIDAEASCSA